MATQTERLPVAVEGAPVVLAPGLSCIPVVAWREAEPPASSAHRSLSLSQDPAAASKATQDITIEPLALILARPTGVERVPLGATGERVDVAPNSIWLADQLPESTRQACVDAVFGAPMASAGGFRVALRRVAARLLLEPGNPQVWRIEILSSEALGEAAIVGGAARSALGMSAEGVYH